MAFKVGDRVVLRAHGVGQIVRLEEKQFAGRDLEWYYEVNTAKSTVWVGLTTMESAGMRALTAPNGLNQCRQVLKGKPHPLNPDHNQRRLEIIERLKQGSLLTMCEVVRDLTAHGWRKPLAEADGAALRRTTEMLYEEWANTAGVTAPEASQEVQALLLEAREAYGH
jgi:RNA polymerase-interacting CarD/CdnL/TRCF family regulator